MRVLFWYCEKFAWTPAMKTIADVPDAAPQEHKDSVVAFIHVEPDDVKKNSSAETKLVKNAKWVARKWETTNVILHSFTHLGEKKADPDKALALLSSAEGRLLKSGYSAVQTPYGYFLDLNIAAKGHPLARIFKEF